MKVSDYIVNFLKGKGADVVFAVTGSGSIRLIESAEQSGLQVICPHHEQAGIMASMTRMRVTKKPAIMMVTGGPGASNTLIALADAHLDSMPLFIIAGQENSEHMHPKHKMRGKGVQGLDMVDITKTVTKFNHCLLDPCQVKWMMEKAFYEAYSGRPGPVWIEIPQNIQWAQVQISDLKGFEIEDEPKLDMSEKARHTIELIKGAQRPLLWVGHGIRLSNSEERFRKMLDRLGVPVLVSWQAADLVPNDHPLFAGRAGIYGQRYANLALQNCDLLIALGTRLAIPQRGYNDQQFARAAKKVICEIDPAEMAKFKFHIDIPVLGNVSEFIDALSSEQYDKANFDDWKSKIRHWQQKYPMATMPKENNSIGINSYWFIDRLSEHLGKDCIIVTDMGASLTCTHATIKLKDGQRIITSTGLGEMGFGLPGAIGAALGAPEKNVVLIVGEGSFMMNLQELQTLKEQKLSIKVFLLNNNGYLTIKHTHHALYKSAGSAGACGPASGLSFPDFSKVVSAFGFRHSIHKTHSGLDEWIKNVLASEGSIFAELVMPEFQELVPKMAVKTRSDGSVYSSPLEDLYPFLSREELEAEMLIPLIEEN